MIPINVPAQAQNLTVSFGQTIALRDVTCALRPGVITGLFGDNGAGKTTLLRTWAGQVKPTSGAATVAGVPAFDHPQVTPHVYLNAPGAENSIADTPARVFGTLARLRPGWCADTAGQLLDRFGLAESDEITKMSTGQFSALQYLTGVAAGTPLTFFDEVLNGLDVLARQKLCDDLLARYAKTPRTIVLSSHVIDELYPIVEDAVVLHAGAVIFAGSVSDLMATAPAGTATLSAAVAAVKTTFLEQKGTQS